MLFVTSRSPASRVTWLALLGFTVLLAGCTCCEGAETSEGLTEASVRMIDLAGEIHLVGESAGTKATVLVFLSTECPIARQFVPELRRLHQEWSGQGVEFYGVFSDFSKTRKVIAAFAEEFDITFPVLVDASGDLLTMLGPTHVPEAFVLNADRRVVYRGRIDDRYPAVGQRRLSPTKRDLQEAVESTVRGEASALVRTEPVGCPMTERDEAKHLARVTFHRDIAPLVYSHCTECHRSGEVAPFTLVSYEDCSKRADWLVNVIDKGQMPPWMAELSHGGFVGERALTDYQKKMLKAWVDAGKPEGSMDDAPAVPHFADGWRLGEPDLVIEAPYDTVVPPDGPDVFQHIVLPIDLPDDKTLVGFEFRPGNKSVVHHAVLFYDVTGAARAKDAKTPEPGYRTFGSPGVPVSGVVGVWVPGMTPRLLPTGVGMPIPKGADLLLQLHIHPNGTEQTDRSKIGLHFAKDNSEEMQRISKVPLVLGTLMIDVPANDSQYKIASQMTLPAPVTLLSVVPHMHLIGREMKITATPPTGETIPLLWIKDWNFYWQDNYAYRKPVDLPAGTKIEIVGVFDNSDANPFNPSRPPKRVFFGNDSDEEMFFAMFQTIGRTREAEMAIAQALLAGFQEDWRKPMVKADARPRIISEAIEFLGGGDIILKLFLKNDRTGGLTESGG